MLGVTRSAFYPAQAQHELLLGALGAVMEDADAAVAAGEDMLGHQFATGTVVGAGVGQFAVQPVEHDQLRAMRAQCAMTSTP